MGIAHPTGSSPTPTALRISSPLNLASTQSVGQQVSLAVVENRQYGKCFRLSIFQTKAKEKLDFSFPQIVLIFKWKL
jgi:hypothetical protein